jgi:TRAP-type C4-dicarboxylate transport system substrate-binding protein
MQSAQGSDRHSSRQARAKRLPRRTVLAAAGLAIPFLPRFAWAAEFTWRIGHSAPANFPLHLRLIEAAAAIATRSEGQMAVEIHPDSELGSPVGLLAQLRAGTIDAVPLSCQMLSKDLPGAAMPMLGFAFAGYDRLWPAIDGDAGGYIRTQIQDRLGLVAMHRCWDFGFRQITTSGKAVKTADDMVGLRLRTPPEADFIGLWKAFKALPVALPLGALESALRSHSIDGQESVLPLVLAAGLFAVQSVCSLTNHIWDGEWICVSGKSWSKLPANLKDIAAAAFDESGLHQRQDIADADASTRKSLESKGMRFNATDPQAFRPVLRKSGYYAAWQTRLGNDAWTALEKYTGPLT